ncbi:MAG: amidohydrolase, partial [Candidatus Bipolaricaulia bacterium]
MDNRFCIDIHAHYYPETYLKLIAEEGSRYGASFSTADERGPVIKVGPLQAGPLERKFIDLDLRLAEMDMQGVQL